MSNHAYLEVYKVQKLTDKEEFEPRTEVRLFDDYVLGLLEIDEAENYNDIELLKYCNKYGDRNVCDLIDSLFESQKGININDTFYDWAEIKHIFDD